MNDQIQKTLTQLVLDIEMDRKEYIQNQGQSILQRTEDEFKERQLRMLNNLLIYVKGVLNGIDYEQNRECIGLLEDLEE